MQAVCITKNDAVVLSDKFGHRAYINTARGRDEVRRECDNDIIVEIEKAWGADPSFAEPIILLADNCVSAIDERIAAVEAVVNGTPSYGELLEAVNILLGE